MAGVTAGVLASALVAVTLSFGGGSAGAGQSVQTAPRGERYVAMGDSFAAGPGIKPLRSGGCARSEKNYASLLADELRTTEFSDVSCSAARTVDFAAPQGTVNPAQYDALSTDTTLVTVGTIGGNDVGLVQLAMACVFRDCTGTPGDAKHREIDALKPALVAVIREVRRRAPEADIVVVGYGTYVPTESCAALVLAPGVELTAAEARYLQGVIDHLSDVWQEAAAAEQVTFADMREVPGAGRHTACAAPEQQWIRALDTHDDGAQLHPSTLGMANWAQQLKRVVQKLRGEPADAWVEVTAPGVTPTTPTTQSSPVATPAMLPSDRQKLAAGAATVRLMSHCRARGSETPRSRPRSRLKVVGGEGLIEKVSFRTGDRVIKTDRSAPFTASTRLRAAPKEKPGRSGRLRARVTLRSGTERKVVRLTTKLSCSLSR